ncbi:Uncharacterised protein [uncultured archaeon]|nr:Uncharacterised protein [uncultured archaeon]
MKGWDENLIKLKQKGFYFYILNIYYELGD